ncbi:Phr family secreted Rap phosphatase inhibitor [Bacillus pseudomycoides]|uniref:Phr family secreted Rap phosphatase inhibitor n=1 Tax=Bacillus pseudomycoides TaxID=64104 RepID=UPI000BEC3907|nr:Phr family secreted Rap phosphatase inhibitor [Bacillus pseudomycoides]PEB42256.1 Phr family secreted Rap phosphatase inhibitor [Bacillus pseudomycoides]PEM69320.1 Phr family secreted Rap phosphatase inhibitor [Bacillus pseudomycoides]PGA62215.1 Phr family secreted Rap phosphatase inhibitor [Bacillus pseudomycoides]
MKKIKKLILSISFVSIVSLGLNTLTFSDKALNVGDTPTPARPDFVSIDTNSNTTSHSAHGDTI